MSDAQWSTQAKQLAARNQQFAADKNKPTEIQESGVNRPDDKNRQRELSLKISQHSVEVRKSLGQRDPKEVHAWLVEQLNNGMSLTGLRMMNEQRMLKTNQKLQEEQGELPRYDSGLQASNKKLQEGHSGIIRAADPYQAPTMNYPEMTPLIEVY